MKWLDALRIFNRDNPGKWCIPKTGTPEYQTVVDIMNGKHMRRQEKIQGSGIIDILGEAYIKNKAAKEKKAADRKAGLDAFMKRADANIAKKNADAAAAAAAPVVGSGRRGRPKGSKNKVKKGGNIFGDFKHSLASVGKTMDKINPITQSHKALLKALNVKVT